MEVKIHFAGRCSLVGRIRPRSHGRCRMGAVAGSQSGPGARRAQSLLVERLEASRGRRERQPVPSSRTVHSSHPRIPKKSADGAN